MVTGFRTSSSKTLTFCSSIFPQNSISPSFIISCINSRNSGHSWIEWSTVLPWYWQKSFSWSFSFSFLPFPPFSRLALTKASYTKSMGMQTSLTSLFTFISWLLFTAFTFGLPWFGKGFLFTFGTFSSSKVNSFLLISSLTLHFRALQSLREFSLLLEW